MHVKYFFNWLINGLHFFLQELVTSNKTSNKISPMHHLTNTNLPSKLLQMSSNNLPQLQPWQSQISLTYRHKYNKATVYDNMCTASSVTLIRQNISDYCSDSTVTLWTSTPVGTLDKAGSLVESWATLQCSEYGSSVNIGPTLQRAKYNSHSLLNYNSTSLLTLLQ